MLDHSAEPLMIVKAGRGEPVDRLLRNEAEWLRTLRDLPQLAGHVPEMVAHRAGADLCFVAQTVLPGQLVLELSELQIHFLRKFHEASRRRLRYEESRLYQNLQARRRELDGLLTEDWSRRIEKAMRRMEEALSGAPILMTAAHNDFTAWNIRVDGGVARVFDWEYACEEQLPLFDPLHFVLMPMALKREPTAKMMQKLHETLAICESWFGREECLAAETQALAYLTNLCTLYLWSQCGRSAGDPVLDSYARVIDCICSA
jgi:Ser/Thr protein kinase RdoA (MazF antagonist)